MSVPAPSRLPSPYVSIKKLNNCLKGEMCHLLVKDYQAPLECRVNVGGIKAGGRCWGGAGSLGANVKRWPPRVQPTLCQL